MKTILRKRILENKEKLGLLTEEEARELREIRGGEGEVPIIRLRRLRAMEKDGTLDEANRLALEKLRSDPETRKRELWLSRLDALFKKHVFNHPMTRKERGELNFLWERNNITIQMEKHPPVIIALKFPKMDSKMREVNLNKNDLLSRFLRECGVSSDLDLDMRHFTPRSWPDDPDFYQNFGVVYFWQTLKSFYQADRYLLESGFTQKLRTSFPDLVFRIAPLVKRLGKEEWFPKGGIYVSSPKSFWTPPEWPPIPMGAIDQGPSEEFKREYFPRLPYIGFFGQDPFVSARMIEDEFPANSGFLVKLSDNFLKKKTNAGKVSKVSLVIPIR